METRKFPWSAFMSILLHSGHGNGRKRDRAEFTREKKLCQLEAVEKDGGLLLGEWT